MSARAKRHDVVILPPAERDLDAIFEWVARDSPRDAMRLFNSLVEAAQSLATFPRRAPIVLRRFAFGVRVRCLVHLNHRILFVVLGKTVFVCRVTHGSRRVPRRFSEA